MSSDNTTATQQAEPQPVDLDAIARALKFDKFMLRWFNFSYLSYITAKAAKMKPVATFILMTKGRKSGKWIDLPIYYFRDGENYVVIASNGGSPKHTQWFLNLQADPNCKFYTRWRTHNARARVATGEERARIWAHASSLYPTYLEYMASAGSREIPVVVLEKR